MAEDEKNQSIDDVPTGQSFEKIEDQGTGGASITEPAMSAEAMVGSNKPDEQSYKVGYRRPPKQTRIKPGERRNPRGRPRGSPNQKTAVLRALKRKVAVPRGDKTSNVTYLEAMTETFALKAVQGDVRAAGVVISLATKAGILDGRNEATENDGSDQAAPAAAGPRPSDTLLGGVDPKLLSRDERGELSQIAARIDAGGGVIALGGDQFARLKNLLNKGRGNDVVPQVDENLEQAA